MTKSTDIREVYFIGIGGIGMSAIARYFHSKGVKVSGYDKTSTALTKDMERAGIEVHYTDDVSLIPSSPDLVVYTPAIPADHIELNHYRSTETKVVKRSDVLQLITQSSFNICVAGTHGKTTISTMIAHLLRDSGYGANAFLGGISGNYNTNFWSDPKNVCVIEADEYDRSFLKLSPDVAVISAMDADHLDIYGTTEAVEQAFIDFSERLKQGGLLIHHIDLKKLNDVSAAGKKTYSLNNSEADIYATNVKMLNGNYVFDVQVSGHLIPNVELNMGGLHNIENAIAAIAVGSSLEIEDEKIKKAIASFKGVKRRFEYVVKTDEMIYIDDYAHHPEELRSLLEGARGLFPEHELTIIFQPHLFSRTRDFAADFSSVLKEADHVILLPIYPARELPVEGVTSDMLVEGKNMEVMPKEQIIDWIRRYKKIQYKKLLITAGAGDIDTLIEPIQKLLNEQ